MREIYRRLARSPASSLTALGVLLSVATVVLFLVDLEARYWDRIATAKTDALSFAAILAEHTALTFEDVDHVLSRRRPSAETAWLESTATPARPMPRFASCKRARPSSSPSDGPMRRGNRSLIPMTTRLHSATYPTMSFFTAQRDSSGGSAVHFAALSFSGWRQMVHGGIAAVEQPRRQLRRRRYRAARSILFSQALSLDRSRQGRIDSLAAPRRDSFLRGSPSKRMPLGNPSRIFRFSPNICRASATGSLESTSPIDGVARVVGYSAVSGLPLVLIVSYARSDVLAPWYHHLYTFGPLVAAIVVIILFGTFTLVRQTNILAANTRALASTYARFDAALSNMPDGLSMFDADEKLLISNSRYREMYELTAEQVKRVSRSAGLSARTKPREPASTPRYLPKGQRPGRRIPSRFPTAG